MKVAWKTTPKLMLLLYCSYSYEVDTWFSSPRLVINDIMEVEFNGKFNGKMTNKKELFNISHALNFGCFGMWHGQCYPDCPVRLVRGTCNGLRCYRCIIKRVGKTNAGRCTSLIILLQALLLSKLHKPSSARAGQGGQRKKAWRRHSGATGELFLRQVGRNQEEGLGSSCCIRA